MSLIPSGERVGREGRERWINPVSELESGVARRYWEWSVVLTATVVGGKGIVILSIVKRRMGSLIVIVSVVVLFVSDSFKAEVEGG